MKKILYILALITLSSVFFYSCSKKNEGCTDEKATNYDTKAEEDDGSCKYCYEPTNPACTNYDPCYGEENVTAWFDALEPWGANAAQNADTFVVTTDKFLGRNIKFEGKEEGANYTWYIGSETLHTRSFIRSFTADNLIGQTIPVTLVVNKTPNLSCSPNDDGRDSLTRYFEVVDDCASLLADTFIGVWDSAPLDTFELAIIVYTFDPWSATCNEVKLWNFNKQQAELDGEGKSITYHYIRIREATPSNLTTHFRILKSNSNGVANDNSLVGIVSVDKKTVEFDYTIKNDLTGIITNHHFTGRKKH